MAFKLRTSSSSPLQQVGEKGKKNISYKDYRESGNMPASEAKFYQGSGTKRVSADFKNKPKKVSKTIDNDFSKLVGLDKPKPAQLLPKVPQTFKPSKTEEVIKPKKPVITGKIGSDLRRQQYKTAGYKADDTVKKAKVKVAEPVKAKSVKAVATKSGATKKPSVKSATSKVSEKKAPKLAARRASAPKASKNDARKTRKIKKKLSQAAEARAGGNENKALRKEKAAKRKASRLGKK
tara:strand:+ start:39 stop:746 length:708 start_codon:yes stop_codon:yes gene_type:complete